MAPKIAGAGRPAVGDLGIEAIADCVCLREPAVERVGEDLLVTADVEARHGARGTGHRVAGPQPQP